MVGEVVDMGVVAACEGRGRRGICGGRGFVRGMRGEMGGYMAGLESVKGV